MKHSIFSLIRVVIMKAGKGLASGRTKTRIRCDSSWCRSHGCNSLLSIKIHGIKNVAVLEELARAVLDETYYSIKLLQKN